MHELSLNCNILQPPPVTVQQLPTKKQEQGKALLEAIEEEKREQEELLKRKKELSEKIKSKEKALEKAKKKASDLTAQVSYPSFLEGL